MTARTKTLALLAAGTTVVGGVAGTTAATAGPGTKGHAGADGPAAKRHHHGKELRKLARALDVRPGELRKALREATDEAQDASLERFAAVLGVTPDQVRDALEAAKDALTGAGSAPGTPTTPDGPSATAPDAPAGHGATPGTTGDEPGTPGGDAPGERKDAKLQALVAALAHGLGVEPAKVLEAGKQARAAGTEAFAETLADELDVDVDEVTEALGDLRPDGGSKLYGDAKPGTTAPGGETGSPAPAV